MKYRILTPVVQNKDGSVIYYAGEETSLEEFPKKVIANWIEIGAVEKISRRRNTEEEDGDWEN